MTHPLVRVLIHVAHVPLGAAIFYWTQGFGSLEPYQRALVTLGFAAGHIAGQVVGVALQRIERP